MADITDLTWQQWNDAIGLQITGVTYTQNPNDKGGTVTITSSDLSMLKQYIDDGKVSNIGVVKAITKTIDAAIVAQNTVNQNQASGDGILTTFSNQGNGYVLNGKARQIRTITIDYDLDTVLGINGVSALKP